MHCAAKHILDAQVAMADSLAQVASFSTDPSAQAAIQIWSEPKIAILMAFCLRARIALCSGMTI